MFGGVIQTLVEGGAVPALEGGEGGSDGSERGLNMTPVGTVASLVVDLAASVMTGASEASEMGVPLPVVNIVNPGGRWPWRAVTEAVADILATEHGAPPSRLPYPDWFQRATDLAAAGLIVSLEVVR